MNIKILIIAFTVIFSPLTALAGGGHDHGHGHSHGQVPAAVEVNQSQAEVVATLRKGMLINKGKIDKSWRSVKVATAEKKKNGDQYEWLITYKNDQIKEATKKTLYIFISSTGDYIAANFTGK